MAHVRQHREALQSASANIEDKDLKSMQQSMLWLLTTKLLISLLYFDRK